MMLAFWTALALAQPGNPYASEPLLQPQTDNPFAWTVTAPKLAPGGKGVLLLGGMVPPGTLLYRDMLEVTVKGAQGLSVGEIRIPDGFQKPDPAFDGQLRAVFTEDLVVEVQVAAPAGFTGGDVTLELRYQGCRDSLCYPPTTEELVATVSAAK